MLHLIDRRLNPRNRSAVNRSRFLRRYKEHIRGAVKDMIAERSIADMEKAGEVSVPAKDVSEPSFRHAARLQRVLDLCFDAETSRAVGVEGFG
jgi:hypothetical protein